MAADADGDFVVVWSSNNQDGSLAGVFGQRYTSAGAAVGAEFQVNTYTTSQQRCPAVAADADGDFVVVWESLRPGRGFDGVFGQRFALAEEVVNQSVGAGSTMTSDTESDGDGCRPRRDDGDYA